MTSDHDVKAAEDTTPTLTKELKKPELIDRVVAASGLKKKDVTPIVEAMLVVLGQSMSDGEQLSLQPFGKARIAKHKRLPNGEAMAIKLRRSVSSAEHPDAPRIDGAADAPTD